MEPGASPAVPAAAEGAAAPPEEAAAVADAEMARDQLPAAATQVQAEPEGAQPSRVAISPTMRKRVAANISEVDYIEVACITIAKGSFGSHHAAPSRARFSAVMEANEEKALKSRMWSGIVVYNSDEGNLEEAEKWQSRIDARLGYEPEIRAVGALIRGHIKAGNYERADERFKQVLDPLLHPELGDIRPDVDCFHYMVGVAAEAGQIALAERHFREMDRFHLRPALRTYCSLVRGCIKVGQVRRGHRWTERLLVHGCAEEPGGFTIEAVQGQRKRKKVGLKIGKTEMLDSLIKDLARGLSDAGHTDSANRWLGWFVETGMDPKDAPDVWNYVRNAHPQEIIPAVLSGEAEEATGVFLQRGAPPNSLPATLYGETPMVQLISQSALGSARLAATPPLVQMPRIAALSSAISDGEAAGLQEDELRVARTTLALEKRKMAARFKLQEAIRSNHFETLDTALKEARDAGLADGELATGREAMLEAKKSHLARCRLQEAMHHCGLAEWRDCTTPITTPRNKTGADKRTDGFTGSWKPQPKVSARYPRKLDRVLGTSAKLVVAS